MASVPIKTDTGDTPAKLKGVADGLKAIRAAAVGVLGPFARVSTVFAVFQTGLVALAIAVPLAAAVIGTKLVKSLISAGKEMVKLSAAAEEVQAQFDVVFGQSAKEAADELEQFSQAAGRSFDELKKGAANFQDTFVPLGLTRDSAADLSVAFTKLGSDLGSFKDVADDEVFARLQSAMVGNSEAVRKLGIGMSEAALRAAAFEFGITETDRELTANEKLLARVIQLYRGTQDAQQDAIRTSNSFTNVTRRLNSEIRDTKVIVGDEIKEVFRSMIVDAIGVSRAVAGIQIGLAGVGASVTTLIKLAVPLGGLALQFVELQLSIAGFSSEVKAIKEGFDFLRKQEEISTLTAQFLQLADNSVEAKGKLQALNEEIEKASTSPFNTGRFAPHERRVRGLTELIEKQLELNLALEDAEIQAVIAALEFDNYAASVETAEEQFARFLAKHQEFAIISDNIVNGLSDAAAGFGDLGDIAKRTLQNIIRDLAEAALRAAIFKAVLGIQNALANAGSSTGDFAQDTQVPGGTLVPPLQHGGVFTSPTIGLLSEFNQPEVVLPGKRSPRGGVDVTLPQGVNANGGGGGDTFNITIANTFSGGGGPDAGFRESVRQLEDRLRTIRVR